MIEIVQANPDFFNITVLATILGIIIGLISSPWR
jgi:hypothetical protein